MNIRSFRGLLAVTILVAAVAPAASAQMSQPSRFGVKAGVGFPMGDLDDIADMGFHAGLHVNMPIGSGAVSVRVDGDYGRYDGEGLLVDNVTMIGGMANLVVNARTSGGWMPYAFGGVGMYNTEVESGPFDVDDTDFAYNLGVGFDFGMGRASLFAEARWLSIQTEGDATNALPVVLGLRF
ncbi:MAG: outer membrane beta-barrel protein [Gemmatimonadaceae bacterium]